jgi:hypothetical protein
MKYKLTFRHAALKLNAYSLLDFTTSIFKPKLYITVPSKNNIGNMFLVERLCKVKTNIFFIYNTRKKF